MSAESEFKQMSDALLGHGSEDSESGFFAAILRQHILRRRDSDLARFADDTGYRTVFTDEVLAAERLVSLVSDEVAVSTSSLAEAIQSLGRLAEGLTTLAFGSMAQRALPAPLMPYVRLSLSASNQADPANTWIDWRVTFPNGIQMRPDFAEHRKPGDQPLGLILTCPKGLIDIEGHKVEARSIMWTLWVVIGDALTPWKLEKTFDAANCLDVAAKDLPNLRIDIIPILCLPRGVNPVWPPKAASK